MKARTYRQALDDLLLPEGFSRDGPDDWIRTRGDVREIVNLQRGSLGAGVTVNLEQYDLETDRIMRAIPSKRGLFAPPISYRIGALMDGYDHWWRNNPDGPAELKEAVEIYGLPHFDRVRSLQDQAANWYGRRSERLWGPSLPQLAVTLYRMGELSEARQVIMTQPPKTAIPTLVEKVMDVRRWLGCD